MDRGELGVFHESPGLSFLASATTTPRGSSRPKTHETPVLALLLLSTLVCQQPDRLEQLCQDLDSQRATLHVPGMALAVVQDGKVILARGFGKANLQSGAEVKPDSLFAIGSTTKAFTAALAGMLVAEGKMSWDDPITQYLPQFKLPIRGADADAQVTLRDLLCHRTGFTRTDILWASGRASAQEILTASLQAEPWSDFRESWHYNNVMFLAAGEASAAVAKTAWTDLLRQRILKPLGMSSTHVSSKTVLEDERLVSGYTWDEDRADWRALPLRPVDSVAPAGVIYSNVEDMSRWVRFQLAHGAWEGKQLLPAETLHETWTKQMSIGNGMDYGMGWFLQDWKGRKVVQHGGNIDGFAAQVGMIPEAGIGYVLLCNVSFTPLQSMSMGLVWEALLGEAAAEGAADPADDLQIFAGKYDADFGPFRDAVFEVRVEQGKLGVDVPGQMFFTLAAPDQDGKRPFDLTDQIAVSFDRDETGAVRALRMFQSGMVFLLPRQGAAPEGWQPPVEPKAAQFTGPYTFPPDQKDWTVRAPEGRLTIEVPGQTDYELAAPDAEGWRLFRAMPVAKVRFVQDADGATTALEYAQGGELQTLPRNGVAPPAEALPSLEELRALFDEAGRTKAFEKLGGLRLRGTTRFVHGGASGSYQLLLAADGRERRTIDLGVFGAIHSMLDPRGAGISWSESDFEAYRELAGKELQQAVRMSERDLLIRFGGGFDDPAVLRVDEHDGRKYAVLSLKAGELGAMAWLDLETGDLARMEATQVVPGLGGVVVHYRFSEYRDVGGLRVPHKSAYQEENNGRIETILTSVETGVKFDEKEFGRPAPR